MQPIRILNALQKVSVKNSVSQGAHRNGKHLDWVHFDNELNVQEKY